MLRSAIQFTAVALLLSVTVAGLAGCGTAAPSPAPITGSAPTAGDSAALQVSLSIFPDPPAAGPATFTVDVHDALGNPVDGAEVSMAAKHATMMHGGPGGTLSNQGGGKYSGEGNFSMTGQWEVTITAAKAGAEPVTKAFAVAVQ